MRGCVVARALRQRGLEPLVCLPRHNRDLLQRFEVPGEVLARPESPARLRAWVRGLAQQADAVVLDTFPEGILRELREPWTTRPVIGLLRYRRDAAGVDFQHAARALDLAIDLEPHLDWLGDLHRVGLGPVCRELVDPGESARVDVMIAAAEPRLLALSERLGPALVRQGLSVSVVRDAGPAWQPRRARVVIGAAGFNLTYELAHYGIWHLAIALTRSHDDQSVRADGVAHRVGSPQAAVRWCVARVRACVSRPAMTSVDHGQRIAAAIEGYLLAR